MKTFVSSFFVKKWFISSPLAILLLILFAIIHKHLSQEYYFGSGPNGGSGAWATGPNNWQSYSDFFLSGAIILVILLSMGLVITVVRSLRYKSHKNNSTRQFTHMLLSTF